MLLNSTNIKNPYISKHIPQELQSDVKEANKWLWKAENSRELFDVVNAEKGRLQYFKTAPLTSIEEMFKTLEFTYKFLSDWDKDFITDMLDKNNYSIKQTALLLRITSSINYAMWKSNLDRKWLWSQIETNDDFEAFIPKEDKKSNINIDNVKEEELTDETELITNFKMLKDSFDDIMETKLFDHQVVSVNFLMSRETGSGIIASSTGTGKTLVAITYSEQLFLENKIAHTYIFSPLAMVETWKREIVKHSKNKDLTKYTILNYEKMFKHSFENANKSLVILDEGHKLKNNMSKRFQKFTSHKWKYVIPMSATPIGNNLDELKNIYQLINKRAPIKRGQVDLSSLKEDLIRVPKSKLNLPNFVIKEIPIELNDKVEYEMFQNNVLMDIANDRELAIQAGKRPPNELVKLIRLNQYSSNRNIIMDNHLPVEEQNKFKVMFEIIDDEPKTEQFIIWTNFVDTVRNIKEYLSEYFSCEYIDGSIKQEQRDKILDRFRNKEFKILIANPTTLNAGVTLVNTNKMIYFDRDFSSIKYIQAMGRIYRIGQTNNCTMYNLFYENTIEEVIIDVLKQKESMINNILENGSDTELLMTKEIMEKLKR